MAELSDFYNYDTKAGIIIPDTSKVRESVIDIFKTSLGANIDTTAETHIGRLIDSLTVGFAAVIGINAQNASQFNPNYATGKWLDNIAALFGIYRKGRTSTTVTAQLTGAPNTLIPAGSLAQTVVGDEPTGYFFATQNDVTIDIFGAATVQMVCTTPGAIDCASGSLIKIASSISGWYTVGNLVSGIVGREEENDGELSSRVLAGRSTGIGAVESIRNSVDALDCVFSSVILENGDANAKTVDSVSVSAHSIFCCIDFTDTAENREAIASAILSKKTAGCAYSSSPAGVTEITQNVRIGDISYAVKWCKPATLQVPITVSVTNVNYSGLNLEQSVKDAINSYFSENIGVGDNIRVYDIASYIMNKVNGIFITDIKVSGSTSVDVTGYQKAVVQSITVTIS